MQRSTRSSAESAPPRGFVERVLVITHGSDHEARRCDRLEKEIKRHLPNTKIFWLDPAYKKGETALAKERIRKATGRIYAPDFFRFDPWQPNPFLPKNEWLSKAGYEDIRRYHLDPDHHGPGAESCGLGHMLAWVYGSLLHPNADHAGYSLVLESDAVLAPDFAERMKEVLKELDRDSNESSEEAQDEEEFLFGRWTDLSTFDFVYLGTNDIGPRFKIGETCAEHEWTAPARRAYPSVLDQPGFSVVSVGYLLSPIGAIKLLNLVQKVAEQGGKLIAMDELLSVAMHGASNVHPIREFNEWYDGAQMRAYITKKTLVREYDDGHSATSVHGTKSLKVIKHETHNVTKPKEEQAASSSTK